MMEAARTSETLVNFYQTTRRYNPEYSHLRVWGYGRGSFESGQGQVTSLVNKVNKLLGFVKGGKCPG
jgi:hypothetical protein